MNVTYQMTSMEHVGGTKYWECFTLQPEGEYSVLVIRRWGKNGTAGQINIEKFPSLSSASGTYRQHIAAKNKRGYKSQDIKEVLKNTVTFNKFISDTDLGAHLKVILERMKEAGWSAVTELPPKPAVKVHEPEPEIDRGEQWGAFS